jgi:hypothetical protein
MDRSPYGNANFALKTRQEYKKLIYIYTSIILSEIVNIIILIKVKIYFEIILCTTDGIE